MNFADARERLDAWRRHWEKARPHGAAGYNVPIDLQNAVGATSPSP